jgi:hypothetical protein
MFDARPIPPPLPSAFVERAQQAQPATIGHFLFLGLADGKIKRLSGSNRVSGTAVTLALPGMDSILLRHAVGLPRPGDVLVIGRLGDRGHACLGGGVSTALDRIVFLTPDEATEVVEHSIRLQKQEQHFLPRVGSRELLGDITGPSPTVLRKLSPIRQQRRGT